MRDVGDEFVKCECVLAGPHEKHAVEYVSLGGGGVDASGSSLVVEPEGERVAHEVDRGLLEAELGVHLVDPLLRQVDALPRARVALVQVLHVDEELAEAPLLEQPHQPCRES